VRLARSHDYPAWKAVLNAGRHPAFIGQETMRRNANNGGALFYEVDGEAVAVSLINPHFGILLALNVLPSHRSHGLGAAILDFLIPNFARVVEHKVPWFEKRGYKRIGRLKCGISLNTQLMARAELFDLAGKLSKVWGNPS
jgi:GNAT superfamily N-acetyltransferase